VQVPALQPALPASPVEYLEAGRRIRLEHGGRPSMNNGEETMKTQVQQSRAAITGRIRMSAALAALICLGATGAHAYTRSSGSHAEAGGSIVDVSVLVDGQTAPLFFRPGNWSRHYFQAFEGRNYSIQVRNTTNRRVGVLIAVDGLNVVTGDRSNLSRRESMYVLDPWGQATISGWRTSLEEVRRFVFVDEQRSYAERTGQANGDLGWIRVHAFREVEPLAYEENRISPREDGKREGAKQQAPQSAPRTEASRDLAGNESQGESNPGTGWGDSRWDPVHRTHFEAMSQPSDRIAFRYEYASGLQALGIFPRVRRTFDRDNGYYGFAQPPRW